MTSKHLSLIKFLYSTIYLMAFSILFSCSALVINRFLPRRVFISDNLTSSIIGLFVSITTVVLCIFTLWLLSKRIFSQFYDKIIQLAINVVTAISFIDMLFAVIVADCNQEGLLIQS